MIKHKYIFKLTEAVQSSKQSFDGHIVPAGKTSVNPLTINGLKDVFSLPSHTFGLPRSQNIFPDKVLKVGPIHRTKYEN